MNWIVFLVTLIARLISSCASFVRKSVSRRTNNYSARGRDLRLQVTDVLRTLCRVQYCPVQYSPVQYLHGRVRLRTRTDRLTQGVKGQFYRLVGLQFAWQFPPDRLAVYPGVQSCRVRDPSIHG